MCQIKFKGYERVFLNVCLRCVLPDILFAAKYQQTENIIWIQVTVNAWIAQVWGLKLNFKTLFTWERWGFLFSQTE